jgi:hypothetical protein
LVLSDSRYPNERGHQIIAEAIIKHLGRIFDHKIIGEDSN